MKLDFSQLPAMPLLLLLGTKNKMFPVEHQSATDGEAQFRHNRDRPGIVYAVSNPSFPGMLKIGMTCGPIERRIASLSRMVPLPFKLEYTIEATIVCTAEAFAHWELNAFRVNNRREWFQVTVEQAREVMDRAKQRFNPPTERSFSTRPLPAGAAGV